MHPTTDIHQGMFIPQPGGPLPEVHQRIHTYHTALSEYLSREGASRKSEQVSLTKEAMRAFEALKWVCMMAPILVSTNYTKPFLLETDASKDG